MAAYPTFPTSTHRGPCERRPESPPGGFVGRIQGVGGGLGARAHDARAASDPLNRQTATIQPASDPSDPSDWPDWSNWSNAAPGNHAAATNPRSHATYFAYDALDGLSSDTDAIGNGPRTGRVLP